MMCNMIIALKGFDICDDDLVVDYIEFEVEGQNDHFIPDLLCSCGTELIDKTDGTETVLSARRFFDIDIAPLPGNTFFEKIQNLKEICDIHVLKDGESIHCEAKMIAFETDD